VQAEGEKLEAGEVQGVALEGLGERIELLTALVHEVVDEPREK